MCHWTETLQFGPQQSQLSERLFRLLLWHSEVTLRAARKCSLRTKPCYFKSQYFASLPCGIF